MKGKGGGSRTHHPAAMSGFVPAKKATAHPAQQQKKAKGTPIENGAAPRLRGSERNPFVSD